MSRFTFAVLVSAVVASASSPVAAQQVPGRDLLEFPIGLLAEAPPLSSRMAGGLWNPAASALGSDARGEIGFAGLTTSKDQGVSLEMLAGEYRFRPSTTFSLTYTQASVSDIFRTDTDPQTLPGEIHYATSLLSGGLATKIRPDITVGVAARYRWAAIDTANTGVLSVDAGAIVDHVAGTPLRVALSTFLFSPSRSREAATYEAAVDGPVYHRDSTVAVRAGVSVDHTDGRGHEGYVFTTATYHEFDASAGLVQSRAYGTSDQRVR
ncbi:MAG TPA: hypothetical protein VGM50_03075, partial [Gemmatimonadaceae bacterium]